METSPNNKKEYSFERKKKMASKISDMTDKTILRKIQAIIRAENSNPSAKKTNNGLLMFFQNYTDETYQKIEKLLNNHEQEKIERQTRSVTEMSSEDPNTNYTVSRTRLRYSNREKRLIKRRQYETIINEKIIDCDMCTDNVNTDNIGDTINELASTSDNDSQNQDDVSDTNNVTKKEINKNTKNNQIKQESDEQKVSRKTKTTKTKVNTKATTNVSTTNTSTSNNTNNSKKNSTIFSKVKL